MLLVVVFLVLSLQTAGQFCTNTCSYATDDYCDDGGPGSEYPLCTYGTDCFDCGPRQPRPPSASPPARPPLPPRAPQCSNGLPVDLVLVFDHSGSMQTWQADVLEFATELVLQLDFGANAARVGLVEFDDESTILSNLTHNTTAMLAAMANAQQAQGWTSISSGLAAGLAVLTAGDGSRTRPKVLVVMTDGGQSPQFGGDAAAIAQAAAVRAAGVEIFGIGFGTANPATIVAISSAPASHYAYTTADMATVRDHFHGRFCSLVISPRAPPPPSPPPAPPSMPPVCLNTCMYASDSTCSDGGPGSESLFCAYGTDCVDCGPRPWRASPPLLPPPSPAPPAFPGGVITCLDTCAPSPPFSGGTYYVSNGICEDGGAGSSAAWCRLGTDCTDCGPRSTYRPPPPPPPPPSPPRPPPRPPSPPAAPYDCGQLFCVTSGQQFCQTTGHIATGRGQGQCVWDGDGIHDNNERCTIQTIYPSAISAVYYEVEANWDYMRITYPATSSAPPMNSITASGYAPGICPGAPGAPGTSCANCALGGSCSGTQSGTSAFNAMANISAAPAGTRLSWSTDSSVVRGGFIICFDAIVPFPPSSPPAPPSPPRPPTSPPAPPVAPQICLNTCMYASDSTCSDGGPGSESVDHHGCVLRRRT